MNLLKSIRNSNPLSKWTQQARRMKSTNNLVTGKTGASTTVGDVYVPSPLPEWEINVKGNSGKILQMGLGVGTYHGEEASQSVVTGLKNGFRLIDNAMMQGNQEAVGAGLKRSGLPRDQF